MGQKRKSHSVITQEISLAEQLFAAPVIDLSPTQEHAMYLYHLGFNVFPTPYLQKGGWPWKRLQFTRLNVEDLYPLFSGRVNTAVMMGRTSGNLFVIDCETKKIFAEMERKLEASHIPIWAVRSGGRKGGGHFYLRCKEGEVANIRAGERDGYEIRGNRGYVLAPISVHPDGGRYDWYKREGHEPPIVSLDQLVWLSLSLATDKNAGREPEPFGELAKSTRDFIAIGAAEGERNDRLFSAACDLQGNFYTHFTAMQLLMPIARKIGLSDREAKDTINSAYSRQRLPAKVRANPQTTIKPHQKALAWIQTQTWKGKAGQTDRAVLMACCQRASSANPSGIFRASTREVAELAQVTQKTAFASLRRLVQQGLLICVGHAPDSGAGLYRLGSKTQQVDEKFLRIYVTNCYPVGRVGIEVNSQKNDAFEEGALGKVARLVYEALEGLVAPARGKELATLTGLSQDQVYRALRKLAEYGLTRRIKGVGGGYVVVSVSDEYLVEAVAAKAGTLGKGEERRKLHQRQRMERAAEPLYKARWPERMSQNQELPKKQRKPQQKPAEHVQKVEIEAKGWECGNCGQIWHMPGLTPPFVCDYCQDATTWKPLKC